LKGGGFIEGRRRSFIVGRRRSFIEGRRRSYIEGRRRSYIEGRRRSYIEGRRRSYIEGRRRSYIVGRRGSYIVGGVAVAEEKLHLMFGISQRRIFTPESAITQGSKTFVNILMAGHYLDRIVVDECHYLLSGNNEFCPNLTEIKQLLLIHSTGVQVVLLTATLPPSHCNTATIYAA
jgi:hypothetical protein